MYPDEQRDFPRAAAIYSVGFEHYVGSQKVGEGRADTLNISGRGLAIESRAPIQPNDVLIVWLFSANYPLCVRGTVKYCQPTARGTCIAGVELDELLDGQWEIFERDIAQRLTRQYLDA